MGHPVRVPRILLAVLALGCASAPSDPSGGFTVGHTLGSLTLEDARGTPHAIDEDVDFVLYSRDMDGGTIVRETLDRLPPDFLERHDGVYVADISRMPGLISRAIALPRMRARPYTTLVDLEGETTSAFPTVEGQATLVFLDDLKVIEVRFIGSREELGDALTD